MNPAEEQAARTIADLGLEPEDLTPTQQSILAIPRKCRGPISDEDRKTVADLLRSGDHDGAKAHDRASREPCGFDVNRMILSEELDGEEHATACPGCGTVISWIPATEPAQQ
jgi:hypothetical protein